MAVHLDHRLQWALPVPLEVWVLEARRDHRRHLEEAAHLPVWVVLLSHLHLEEAAHLPVWVLLLSHLHLEEAAHLPVWVVLLSHLHFEALEWALEVPHLLLLGLLPKADSCSSCLGLVVVMNRVTHKKERGHHNQSITVR